MRFLTADYLYPLHTSPLKQGVLQLSKNGEVISILKDRKLVPEKNLEFFNGILCPGFVNAHCHLELSHLFEKIERGSGLLDFIASIKKRNNFDKEDISNAIVKAEQQMIKNGIVAVGDICNTSDTLFQKKKCNLTYYNFIEVFGVLDENTHDIITKAQNLRNQFRLSGLKSTITPHSPYSVSKKLMREIAKNFDDNDDVIAVHIQETIQENKLLKNKTGDFLTWLQGINAS